MEHTSAVEKVVALDQRRVSTWSSFVSLTLVNMRFLFTTLRHVIRRFIKPFTKMRSVIEGHCEEYEFKCFT